MEQKVMAGEMDLADIAKKDLCVAINKIDDGKLDKVSTSLTMQLHLSCTMPYCFTHLSPHS